MATDRPATPAAVAPSEAAEGDALVECGILGPVRITHGSHVLPFGSTKEAGLLAALAHDAGRTIGSDQLIARVWGNGPSPDPDGRLQAQLSKLRRLVRRFLAEAGAQPLGLIPRSRSHGYTLGAGPEAVDRHRYEQLAGQARDLAASGNDAGAVETYRRADVLWRGEPLAGLGTPWAREVRAELEERRLTVTLERLAAQLRLELYADALGELRGLITRYPGDEELTGHLITALYGRGLREEALHRYEHLRRRLRDDLGNTPGPDLLRLHGLMVADAPRTALLPPRPSPRRAAPAPAVPPSPVPSFQQEPQQPVNTLPLHARMYGREEELRRVVEHLSAPHHGIRHSSGPQLICGMPGVGKSLLAITAAERLTAFYPDAALYVSLRAFAPGLAPVTPRAALSHMLRSVGVQPNGTSADDLDVLVGQWRSATSRRRMVIVLDDAASAEQVRPLLPGSPSSVVLITSRRQLTALPGLRPVPLDVLPEEDARALFRGLVDDDRTSDEREISTIVSLAGLLPLGLEIAASRLNSRPNWSLGHLIRKFSREHDRLTELRDSEQDLGAVFRFSYNALTTEERTVFRLMSLHPGPVFCSHSAAALTGIPLDQLERAAEELVNTSLLQSPMPDRFRYHDLLNEFARSLLAPDEVAQVENALGRLIVFYVAATDAAARMLDVEHLRLEPPPSAFADRHLPSWNDTSEAEEWLLVEQVAILEVARQARARGLHGQAALLAHTLSGFLEKQGFWLEAVEAHTHAAHHWHTTGNRRGEILARVELGKLHNHAARFDEAIAEFRHAVDLATATEDGTFGTEALHQLGVTYWNMGRFNDALTIQQQVIAFWKQDGNKHRYARAVNNKGITHRYLGQYDLARADLRLAYAEFQELGDRDFIFRVLNNLADLFLVEGDRVGARRQLDEARALLDHHEERARLPLLEMNYASTFSLPDEFDTAIAILNRAFDTCRVLGDRRNEAICLNEIGRSCLLADRPAEAVPPHTRALELARRLGASVDEAQSLIGLGKAHKELGHLQTAAQHLAEALDIAEQANFPVELEEAESELRSLGRNFM